MAGFPPGAFGAPPQGMPPGAPGLPPPAMGPMMGQSPPLLGMNQPPPQDIYADVSQDLPHHWQAVDAAAMVLDGAIKSGGFYTEPDVLAHLRSYVDGLKKMIDVYARKVKPVGGIGGESPGKSYSKDQGSNEEGPGEEE